MKRNLLIALSLVFALSMNAQKTEDVKMEKASAEQKARATQKREMRAEKHKEIEAQKVAYITTKIKLTPEESQAFWPLYNAHEAELDALKKAERESKRGPKKSPEEMSDAEVEKAILSKFKFGHDKLNLDEKYYQKYKSVLSVKKVGAFYKANDDFRRELLKSLKGKEGQEKRMQDQRREGPKGQERINAPQK